MSRKKKYPIPIWKHNPKEGNEKFIQVYHDLLMNKNFMSMTPSSKLLYFYMLDYSLGNREFKFPYSIYSKITSRKTFQASIKELTEKGFIEVIVNGKNTRTPNVYKFINNWYSDN